MTATLTLTPNNALAGELIDAGVLRRLDDGRLATAGQIGVLIPSERRIAAQALLGREVMLGREGGILVGHIIALAFEYDAPDRDTLVVADLDAPDRARVVLLSTITLVEERQP